MLRRKRWVAVGALAGAFTIFGAGSALAAGGWTTVSIPATGNNTDLHGVFALTNTDAWAVGQQFGAAGQAPPPPAIYHWNGTAWSLVSSPALPQASGLAAVSASSATDAWAVGSEKVGRGRQTLFEHWNGAAWSVDTADSAPGGLGAVLDLSPANAYAVGNANGSMLQHWNGTSWSPVTLPDSSFATPGGGQDISATSASDIWLVGTNAGQAEALHFNGTAWTVVPMAQPPANPDGSTTEIGAVTAISPTDAWAVGEANGGTLIEHWNGTSWTIVPSPIPSGDPALTGVAARSATDVYAVGQEPGVNGPFRAVILRWNGTAWADDTGGTAFGVTEAAATFPGATREWAVGITSGNQGQILSHS